MSDDTTTWLKKNPAINPLRRSLKTSLRYHVPSSDMNTSIMSNPDKAKDQGLFIPKMLQRSNMQMRKSKAHQFKIPDLTVAKPAQRRETLAPVMKVKKIVTPNRVRKSLLPVPKTKGADVNVPIRANIPRPSFVPVGSGRRTAKRDLIKKLVELSEIKRKEEAAESQAKGAAPGESSVLRSILKKRASLRRASQISGKKAKAKKVLFDGFENSDGEKENDAGASAESQNDFNNALDEPTVFLNIPNTARLEEEEEESPLKQKKQPSNWTVEEDPREGDIRSLIKLWESYKENVDSIESARAAVEESFESLLEHSLNFQKEYRSYKKTSEGMYAELSKLRMEIEESLKRVTAPGGGQRHVVQGSTPRNKRKSTERRVLDRWEKIKMSDKSKAIKRSSGRKSVPLLKKDLLNDLEDSFSVISKNSFLNN